MKKIPPEQLDRVIESMKNTEVFLQVEQQWIPIGWTTDNIRFKTKQEVDYDRAMEILRG